MCMVHAYLYNCGILWKQLKVQSTLIAPLTGGASVAVSGTNCTESVQGIIVVEPM